MNRRAKIKSMTTPREQTLDTIRELTPEQEEMCLAIEKRLKEPSAWHHRKMIKEFADYSAIVGIHNAAQDEHWLSVAWSLLDVIREVKAIEKALGIDDE